MLHRRLCPPCTAQVDFDDALREVDTLRVTVDEAEAENTQSFGPAIDQQLIEACKAVDAETLVEIAQRFHQMQDDFDEAQEQVRIGGAQLKQSRVECDELAEQLESRVAETEVQTRKFRLQIAKTKRWAHLQDCLSLACVCACASCDSAQC